MPRISRLNERVGHTWNTLCKAKNTENSMILLGTVRLVHFAVGEITTKIFQETKKMMAE